MSVPAYFLSRFLRRKETPEDQAVFAARKSPEMGEMKYMDRGDPYNVRQLAKRATRAELQEALEFAERMDYGDIATEIKERLREMDTAAFGVVREQLEKKMGRTGPTSTMKAFLQPEYVLRKGRGRRKTHRRRKSRKQRRV